MNVDILRRDMNMLEKGINISNHMKKDNITAKNNLKGNTDLKQ